MAIPFDSFEDAVKNLPNFIGGYDPVGQHKTIGDLRHLVRHEIDLYTEGDPNEIECKTQAGTTRRLRACKYFIARCDEDV